MRSVVSVVVPVLNEEEILDDFLARMLPVFEGLRRDFDYELIFVDDGSTDSSRAIIRNVAQLNPNVKLLALSRNFGHQAAIAAGMQCAVGDAVVTIDCDLQDPPEVIPQLIQAWQQGADVVLAKRVSRQGETRRKLVTAHIFYRMMSALSDTRLSEDVADFRLLSRVAVDELNRLAESAPYFRGLVNWIGFNQAEVEYHRDARLAGETKYTLKKMLRLAVSGLTSFSEKPLYLVSLLGFVIVALSACTGLVITILKVIEPSQSVPGYVTVLLAILFLGGIQLLSIGVLGVYLANVNQNSKRRPRFIIWSEESRGI